MARIPTGLNMGDWVNSQLGALSACVFLIGALAYIRSSSTGRKLPPGPNGIPLLGNVLQVPTEHLATYFRVLCKKYGDIVSLNLLGSTVIVIGDRALAKELMEKRSAKYSGRPVEPYISRYLDPDKKYWSFLDPGETFRVGKKLTNQVMAGVRAGRSHSLHRYEAMLTLQHIIQKPDGWYHHIDRFATSIIVSAMFGVRFTTGKEKTIMDIVQLNHEFKSSISSQAASIINVFPFLDYIPGPMPWRKRAAEFRHKEKTIYGNLATKAIEGENSRIENWAQYFAGKDNDIGDCRELLNLLPIAAAHTTAMSLQVFVLACMCHPEWIKSAQAQIDLVVGPTRLPNFSDREKIPYIEAVCREVLRWRPAARFGVPHKATADDVVHHNGKEYYIPKNSTVFGVPWIIEHDPAVYSDPDAFKPERWLDANGQLSGDYDTTAFGWGRRACPGSPFAERSLWINVVLWLWTFDIRRVPGHTYVSDDSAFLPDFATPPKPFPAVFKLRSPQHELVGGQEWQNAEQDLAALLPMPKAS
ncbi:cytochrome P450 [Mycena sanguinolenta]|nr:cytochrome P450 [Mycena sanguinolenta]